MRLPFSRACLASRRVGRTLVFGALLASSGLLSVFLNGRFAVAQAPAPAAAAAENSAPTFTAAELRMRADLSFLAADAQEGREPGTKGIETSAQYIADSFKQSGLKPAPGADGYFQPFRISGQAKLGAQRELALIGPDGKQFVGEASADFNPMGIGAGCSLDRVPIVFAGYGITAHSQSLGLDYDDYAGIDVKGKAVLIIRREPQQNDPKSPFSGTANSPYAPFQHKATNAFQHGAAAVLFVNDLAGLKGEPDRLLNFNAAGNEPTTTIPFVMLRREFADSLLAAAGAPSLKELEKSIDSDLKPRSRLLENCALSAKIQIDFPSIPTKNVVGVLEGAGPHAKETVVIGGHYDHLGHGGSGSGSMAMLSTDIHNGADDNASGTTMVLELARRLGARKDPLPRRVVFIAFSGEERGLLGSQYYCEHPLFPLASTVMMINCDMVGRLTRNELTMIGTGTTPGISQLVTALGADAGLTIKQVAGMTDGFGGSDHQSFYTKDVPVLFAFTGVHLDYHRPSDDADRINYQGMGRIADYLELIALDIIRRPVRPALVKMDAHGGGPPRGSAGAPSPSPDPARMGSGVTLGTMPDYEYKTGGLKLSDVRPGGPASRAGIKGGDIIVVFGGKPIGTIYDYMESLKGYKPGDQVEVIVKRAGKDVKFNVKLESRSTN